MATPNVPSPMDLRITHYDRLAKDYDRKGTFGGLALGSYYQGIADGLRMVRDGSITIQPASSDVDRS